jgi:hypothetical protein
MHILPANISAVHIQWNLSYIYQSHLPPTTQKKN